MVTEVSMHFIDNFKHAAIDVNLEMGIQKGTADTLATTQNKLLEVPPSKELTVMNSFTGQRQSGEMNTPKPMHMPAATRRRRKRGKSVKPSIPSV